MQKYNIKNKTKFKLNPFPKYFWGNNLFSRDYFVNPRFRRGKKHNKKNKAFERRCMAMFKRRDSNYESELLKMFDYLEDVCCNLQSKNTTLNSAKVTVVDKLNSLFRRKYKVEGKMILGEVILTMLVKVVDDLNKKTGRLEFSTVVREATKRLLKGTQSGRWTLFVDGTHDFQNDVFDFFNEYYTIINSNEYKKIFLEIKPNPFVFVVDTPTKWVSKTGYIKNHKLPDGVKFEVMVVAGGEMTMYASSSGRSVKVKEYAKMNIEKLDEFNFTSSPILVRTAIENSVRLPEIKSVLTVQSMPIVHYAIENYGNMFIEVCPSFFDTTTLERYGVPSREIYCITDVSQFYKSSDFFFENYRSTDVFVQKECFVVEHRSKDLWFRRGYKVGKFLKGDDIAICSTPLDHPKISELKHVGKASKVHCLGMINLELVRIGVYYKGRFLGVGYQVASSGVCPIMESLPFIDDRYYSKSKNLFLELSLRGNQVVKRFDFLTEKGVKPAFWDIKIITDSHAPKFTKAIALKCHGAIVINLSRFSESNIPTGSLLLNRYDGTIFNSDLDIEDVSLLRYFCLASGPVETAETTIMEIIFFVSIICKVYLWSIDNMVNSEDWVLVTIKVSHFDLNVYLPRVLFWNDGVKNKMIEPIFSYYGECGKFRPTNDTVLRACMIVECALKRSDHFIKTKSVPIMYFPDEMYNISSCRTAWYGNSPLLLPLLYYRTILDSEIYTKGLFFYTFYPEYITGAGISLDDFNRVVLNKGSKTTTSRNREKDYGSRHGFRVLLVGGIITPIDDFISGEHLIAKKGHLINYDFVTAQLNVFSGNTTCALSKQIKKKWTYYLNEMSGEKRFKFLDSEIKLSMFRVGCIDVSGLIRDHLFFCNPKSLLMAAIRPGKIRDIINMKPESLMIVDYLINLPNFLVEYYYARPDLFAVISLASKIFSHDIHSRLIRQHSNPKLLEPEDERVSMTYYAAISPLTLKSEIILQYYRNLKRDFRTRFFRYLGSYSDTPDDEHFLSNMMIT